MLTLAQVAEQLGVSTNTVRREVAEGHLQALQIRGIIRVSTESLEAYKCQSVKEVSAGRSASRSTDGGTKKRYRPEPAKPMPSSTKPSSGGKRSILWSADLRSER